MSGTFGNIEPQHLLSYWSLCAIQLWIYLKRDCFGELWNTLNTLIFKILFCQNICSNTVKYCFVKPFVATKYQCNDAKHQIFQNLASCSVENGQKWAKMACNAHSSIIIILWYDMCNSSNIIWWLNQCYCSCVLCLLCLYRIINI